MEKIKNNSNKIEKKVYISTGKLKERKWTEGAIKKFLKEPDKMAQNPFYSKAPEMRLYLLERVEEAEKQQDFQDWLNKSKPGREKISQKSLETAEKRRKELFDYIDKLNIFVQKMPEETLYKSAVKHYNKLWFERGKDNSTDINASKDFLNRIAVNMLRHKFSHYENELDNIFGKVGVDDAYILLKNKVLNKIAEIYPFLATECEKQSIK